MNKKEQLGKALIHNLLLILESWKNLEEGPVERFLRNDVSPTKLKWREKNLKTAINHWRRQVEYIDIMATDSQNVQALKTERDALGRARDDIEEQMASLLQLSPDESFEDLAV